MTHQLAKEIFDTISETRFQNFKDTLLKKAIAYAHIRAEWRISDIETRIGMDTPRRIAHNALIDSINILARQMRENGEPVGWYIHLKDKRIEVAEFACWVHNFLSLSA